MTLITFQDGKPVLRDGKVGTEQECCCNDCGCELCEGDQVSVTIEGQVIDLPTAGEFEFVELENVPANGNTLGCVRSVNVIWGCSGDAFWDSYLAEKPANWPSGKIVVWLNIGWQSNDDSNVCGEHRDLFYVLNCDGNGCPADGGVFYDSGAVDDGDCDGPLSPPELSFNTGCQGLPGPSSVSTNPLP